MKLRQNAADVRMEHVFCWKGKKASQKQARERKKEMNGTTQLEMLCVLYNQQHKQMQRASFYCFATVVIIIITITIVFATNPHRLLTFIVIDVTICERTEINLLSKDRNFFSRATYVSVEFELVKLKFRKY